MGKVRDSYIAKTFISYALALIIIFVCLILVINNREYRYNEANTKLELSRIISCEYPYKCIEEDYTLLDSKGNVIDNSINMYNNLDSIDLREFMDNYNTRYSEEFVTYKYIFNDNNELENVLLVQLDGNLLFEKESNLFLVGIITIGFIIFFICIFRFIRNDIIRPINLIHNSCNAILLGNYDSIVDYSYDGEIGSLANDFELMRDELKNSLKIQNSLKENEQLLIACISHDLKTPVANISGYVEAIRDGIAKDKKTYDSYINTILSKTKLLTKMIDDILTYSNSQFDKLNYSFEEIYVKEYFEDILSELKVDANSKDIKMEYKIKCNVLCLIDPKRFTQVLHNVIYNSIKYCNENGEIKVVVSYDNHYLNVMVNDNGVGIAKDDLPFIFNRFYRAEKARTSNVSGSGLGLSIVKDIVGKHKGMIDISSKVNEGTTVLIKIPIM